MRFMVMVKLTGQAAKDYEAGQMPSEEDLASMMKFNEALVDAGVMQAGEGLHPTPKGARVGFGGGKPVVTDGPFAESKELLGGYWIWQVGSKEEALEWASKAPMAEGDVLELRQVFEPEDFGSEVAARERELLERMQKEVQPRR
jgi:hypothetical protein